MLTRDDVERGDRVVVTLSNGDDTVEYAGEIVGLAEHRIRIDSDEGIVKRIRVGINGAGQPGGAQVVTQHDELARDVVDLEFEG